MKIRPCAKTVVAAIGAFFTIALAILTPLTGVLPEKLGGYLTVAVAILTALSVYWAKNGNKILDTLGDIDDNKYIEAAIQVGQVGGDTSDVLGMVLGELQKMNCKQTAQLGIARRDSPSSVEYRPPVVNIESMSTEPIEVIQREIQKRLPSEVSDFVRSTWGANR